MRLAVVVNLSSHFILFISLSDIYLVSQGLVCIQKLQVLAWDHCRLYPLPIVSEVSYGICVIKIVLLELKYKTQVALHVTSVLSVPLIGLALLFRSVSPAGLVLELMMSIARFERYDPKIYCSQDFFSPHLGVVIESCQGLLLYQEGLLKSCNIPSAISLCRDGSFHGSTSPKSVLMFT